MKGMERFSSHREQSQNIDGIEKNGDDLLYTQLEPGTVKFYMAREGFLVIKLTTNSFRNHGEKFLPQFDLSIKIFTMALINIQVERWV